MAATATLLTRSIQGESLSAATDRLVNAILLVEGVVDVPGNSFQVLQNLGTDMNVKIGSGTANDKAVVKGDLAGQGTFLPQHQNATQVLAVAASDPTLDRIDLVILKVYDDTFDSSGNDYADLEVITGTPDASPVAPALPSTAISLAEILVQNAVTQIVNGDITDKRVTYRLRGELRSDELRNSTEVTTVTVTTTEAAHASVSLIIPTDWGSWECEAYATYVREVTNISGEPSVNTLSTQLRIDGTDQQVQDTTRQAHLATTGDPQFLSAAIGGRRTGMTTIGSRTIELRMVMSGGSNTVKDIYLYARAIRTS